LKSARDCNDRMSAEPGEFELIDTYFRGIGPAGANGNIDGAGLLLGIGDDAALLRPVPGEALVLTTDTLVAGRHFAPDAGRLLGGLEGACGQPV